MTDLSDLCVLKMKHEKFVKSVIALMVSNVSKISPDLKILKCAPGIRLLCERGWRQRRRRERGLGVRAKGEEGVKRGLLRVTEVEAWRRPTH